jgi:hypothetical protein
MSSSGTNTGATVDPEHSFPPGDNADGSETLGAVERVEEMTASRVGLRGDIAAVTTSVLVLKRVTVLVP